MTGEHLEVKKTLLSFENQLYMRALFRDLLRPQSRILFVLGAGVSMDRGLPSWPELLSRLAERIVNDSDIADVIRADTADPTRRAEYLLRYIKNDDHHLAECIRHALYDHSGTVQPHGMLTDAVRLYLSQAPSRVRVVTTNFDSGLEGGSHPPGKPFVLDKKGILKWRQSQSSLDVMHLHGLIEPLGGQIKGRVLLAESQFFRHGQAVREFLEEEFRKSVVVLLGVSLTDANIFGALLSTQPARTYAFATPDPILPLSNQDPAVARWENMYKFAILRGSYLESVRVRPILVRSYARLAQVFMELRVALQGRPNYMTSNPTKSTRFGFRLSRELSQLHTVLARRHDGDRFGTDLSNALHDALEDKQDGPLGILDFDPSREHFALFLWLHPYSENDEPRASDHLLELVGTSQYVHRSRWSIKPGIDKRDATIEVRPSESFPQARAAFFGRTEIATFQASRSTTTLWRSAVATPVFSKTSVPLGVIVLNSTLPIDGEGEPLSAVRALIGDSADAHQNQVRRLSDRLVWCAETAIDSLYSAAQSAR